MELAHGRRDGYHYCRGEDQEEASKNLPFTPSSSFSLTWFPHAEAAAPPIETEHMFDKVVTPSDVGKLNRLVIPKQYAEKYFPLDPSMADKGLSLCFEDRTGKPWPFRYSYWNSSQSYVLTKGWSRFVKEKSLKAGDVVSFRRSSGQEKQLYIDWNPRGVAVDLSTAPQVVKLFGVNIFRTPVGCGGGGEGKGGREREPFPPEQFVKKQCIGAP